MIQKRVTREDIRAIRSGETRFYTLPTVAALQSAASTAYQMQREIGCTFETKRDFDSLTIMITRR